MPKPTRYIGLDIHKHYLVAAGVDGEQNQVLAPQRLTWDRFDAWIKRHLTAQDAVVIEMTTNTWEVYDALLPHVHSVVVVHPPHVKQIAEARVMTDKIAAFTLAKLLAAKVLSTIWVPPQEVRELRALVAQHRKMTNLGVQAKNRLHSTLHRCQIIPPAGMELFHPDLRPWWHLLKVASTEKIRILCDLETLEFAQKQKKLLENSLAELAAQDERIPLLVQLPGVGLLTAITVLSAIGDIRRFPNAKKLVGYAGLGARVHDSGQKRTTGGITKSGRRDLRRAMVVFVNQKVSHLIIEN
jgi:transposase